MKKIALLLLATFGLVMVATSCGSDKECPAYGNQYSHAEVPVEHPING